MKLILLQRPLKAPENISIGFDTNGKGWMGFISELPGAFVRGKTESEAIAKVDGEVDSYLNWLKVRETRKYTISVKSEEYLQPECGRWGL